MTQSTDCIRQYKREMISRFGRSNDLIGLAQVLFTLIPIALLWSAVALHLARPYWLVVATIALLTLFTLRVFGLMHECGHGSLFDSTRLNRAFGFVLGVVAGMPQYVWSQHHNFHHAHNGNWEKYRGPYTTLSVDEYAALSARQQRMYRLKCSMACAPVVGFIYLIFNPRFTWIKGSVGLMFHVVAMKVARPDVSIRAHAASYRSRYWKSAREYWHMFWNNAVLLSAWAVLGHLCGSSTFFLIYVLSVSLAGAAGIILFTVQHNFEHSYASETERWDHDTAAVEGTSFLLLPGWLNWFTLNIGYHHIHHLSPNIPNYRLVQCHEEYRSLFDEVTRLNLSRVSGALKCILWDRRARRIISVAEYIGRARAFAASA